MSSLLWFALWAALIFLMMRFGCGAHVMGHGDGGTRQRGAEGGRDEGLRWMPPARDVDPVCGRTVITADARPSVHDGYVYYFCSRDCREIFEAAPDTYLSGDRERRVERLEQSHG